MLATTVHVGNDRLRKGKLQRRTILDDRLVRLLVSLVKFESLCYHKWLRVVMFVKVFYNLLKL